MSERVSACVYGGEGSGFDNRWLVFNSSGLSNTQKHLSLLSSSVTLRETKAQKLSISFVKHKALLILCKRMIDFLFPAFCPSGSKYSRQLQNNFNLYKLVTI